MQKMPLGQAGFDYHRFTDSLVLQPAPSMHHGLVAGPVRCSVPNDPMFDQQWHLVNATGQIDINVVTAWEAGYTGQGVTIGVIDDGVEVGHPDLNVDIAKSYDFRLRINDPSPKYDNFSHYNNTAQQYFLYYGDNHGTAVAGAAAATGTNTEGITSPAPGASLAGLRVDFYLSSEQDYADATTWLSSGDDRQIEIKNHSYSYDSTFVRVDLQREALEISSGAGTIHIYAAGNNADDANKRMLQASTESIIVAAVGSDGFRSPYSNYGACVTVTAPSDGGPATVITTDRTDASATGNLPPSSYMTSIAAPYEGYSDGDYSGIFGGTSFAAPVVSGVAAMAVEAARCNLDGQVGTADDIQLDSRAFKHLLARTSAIVDPENPTWATNSAGIHFAPEYGFGLVDAGALTELASHTQGVTPLSGIGFSWEGSELLPDDGTQTAYFPLNVSEEVDFTGNGVERQPLEEITLSVTLETRNRGDISIFLISPSGMESVLCYSDSDDRANDMNWSFTSNAFWGEDPLGDWTLGFLDVQPGNEATVTSYDINFWMGDLVTIPEPTTTMMLLPILLLGACRRRWRCQ